VTVDLGVIATDVSQIESFTDMAHKLGLTGIAVTGMKVSQLDTLSASSKVYRRVELHGRTINSLRKQVSKVRRKTMVVSMPLKGIEVTNWAAEDNRIDLLTLHGARDTRLRESTAHLASNSGTCLEIQIAPLLNHTGLNRSKILKSYRESAQTAMDEGMDVVLTSGANHSLGLRSSIAMVHIGILLGMTPPEAERAVNELPTTIIERNSKKLQPSFIGTGIEVLQKGEEK